MKYLTARSAGWCVLLIVLFAMQIGCASPNGQARRKASREVRALQSGRTENELQKDLMQFLEYAENEIGAMYSAPRETWRPARFSNSWEMPGPKASSPSCRIASRTICSNSPRKTRLGTLPPVFSVDVSLE